MFHQARSLRTSRGNRLRPQRCGCSTPPSSPLTVSAARALLRGPFGALRVLYSDWSYCFPTRAPGPVVLTAIDPLPSAWRLRQNLRRALL